MKQPCVNRFLGGQRKLNVVVGFCGFAHLYLRVCEPTRHATVGRLCPRRNLVAPVFKEPKLHLLFNHFDALVTVRLTG